jgi:nucleotide-binding universal stress UspA family protein
MTTTQRDAPIVVSTDFSEEAAIAVERAAQIAQRLDAPLYVFHVFNSGVWASLKNIYGSALWTGTDLAMTVREQLAQTVADLSARYGIKAIAESETGSVTETITGFVRSSGARLLVIGGRSENWVADLLVGETALQLISQIDVPVLVARNNPPHPPAKLLLATDFSAGAQRAATVALQLFPTARLTLLHACLIPFEGRMRLAGATEADIASYRRAEREKAEAEMSKQIAALGGGDLAEGVVAWGVPTPVILQQAASGTDMIVVGRHGGGFTNERLLGSVARNVLFHAACDVLLAP